MVTVDWLYNRSEVSVFTLIMYFLQAATLSTVDCNTGLVNKKKKTMLDYSLDTKNTKNVVSFFVVSVGQRVFQLILNIFIIS